MRTAWAVIAATLIATPAAAGEDVKTTWQRQVNPQWVLDEVRGETTNVFKFCTIRTVYNAANAAQRRTMRAKELLLMMMYPGDASMSISIAGDDWRMTEGKQYRVRFAFRGGDSYSLTAQGLTERSVIATFKANGDWIKRMMLDSNFTLSINGKELGLLRLDGSAEAIRELMKCAINGRSGVAGNGDTFGDHDDTAPVNGDTF